MRSPKSWVASFRYGVSPQPAHAPENSNSGSSTCEPLTVSWGSRSRSRGAIESKKSQRTRSTGRCSSAGSMLMALWRASDFDLAGHTSTQTPQPVQSSGATWMVSRWSARSFDRNALETKPSGAPASAAGSKTFMRMAAWGQTMAHLAQSMQMSGSQIGISAAMARFSYLAVPDGKVPSGGIADTGSRSPSPASITAVTRCTKSGASAGTGGGRWRVGAHRGGHRAPGPARRATRRWRRSCGRRRSGPAWRRPWPPRP